MKVTWAFLICRKVKINRMAVSVSKGKHGFAWPQISRLLVNSEWTLRWLFFFLKKYSVFSMCRKAILEGKYSGKSTILVSGNLITSGNIFSFINWWVYRLSLYSLNGACKYVHLGVCVCAYVYSVIWKNVFKHKPQTHKNVYISVFQWDVFL